MKMRVAGPGPRRSKDHDEAVHAVEPVVPAQENGAADEEEEQGVVQQDDDGELQMPPAVQPESHDDTPVPANEVRPERHSTRVCCLLFPLSGERAESQEIRNLEMMLQGEQVRPTVASQHSRFRSFDEFIAQVRQRLIQDPLALLPRPRRDRRPTEKATKTNT